MKIAIYWFQSTSFEIAVLRKLILKCHSHFSLVLSISADS